MKTPDPKKPAEPEKKKKSIPVAGTVDSATGNVTFSPKLQKALEEGGAEAFWKALADNDEED